MRMGIGNGTELPVCVKGVERLECRNFSRFHYRKLRYSALKRARAHQWCARAMFWTERQAVSTCFAPAIVLAGMALGGLICGRSILSKRRKTTKETT
jgi:hypothetical protein